MLISQNMQNNLRQLARPLSLLLIVTVLALAARTVAAQTLNKWSTNGPDGATVLTLAIDPVNPATIYAGTNDGVFKSTNGGESWRRSLSSSNTRFVLVAPTAPMTVYAGGRGIHKSTDGGATWNAVNDGLLNQDGPIYLTALTIDPTNESVVYAAGADIEVGGNYKAIYKSTDGGNSWHITKHSINQTAIHNVLAVDPTDANVVYAAGSIIMFGTASAPVWKSPNNGAYWDIFYLGADVRSAACALAIDPTNTNILYAGTSFQGVQKSIDGGVTWNAFNDGLPSHPDDRGGRAFSMVNSIVIDPTNPNIIYAASYGAVFKSSNGGSWSALSSDLAQLDVHTLAINSNNPNIMYAGTSIGVFKTINGGANWKVYNQGLRGISVYSLAVNPGNANVYAGMYPDLTSKSLDNGQSWSNVGFYPIAFDPHNPNTIYGRLAGSYGFFKSTNGGATWSAVNVGAPNAYASSVSIDPSNSNVIYATVDGLYKSTDSGKTWSTVDGLYYPFSVTVDPKNSNTLYAIASDAVGDNEYAYKSTDAGKTWKLLANDDKISLTYVTGLTIDPINTANLYVFDCSSICGFYKSTDSGGSWSPIAGLPSNDLSYLVIDTIHPNNLYVGSYDDGVFKSGDGGETWSSFNDGLTDLNVYALAIDAGGKFMHAGTTSGVFDLRLVPVEPNLIDDTQFFVRQQYRDFLNRDPDADGFNFWTGQIFINPCLRAFGPSLNAGQVQGHEPECPKKFFDMRARRARTLRTYRLVTTLALRLRWQKRR